MDNPTFIVALILGAFMLCATMWVYIRKQVFGLGGSVLTVFGAVLIGMPVWKTIDVSVGQDGVNAKFEQMQAQITEVKKDADIKITQVERRTAALEQYEVIQAQYAKHKKENDCTDLRNIVEKIRVYSDSDYLVPEGFRYSVRYPSIKARPTISDLVTDRIGRIKRVKSQCF